MLNELDRAAATPADTGAARPPISKTLQIDALMFVKGSDDVFLISFLGF